MPSSNGMPDAWLKPKCGRHARVRHGNDKVGFDRRFARQFGADVLADLINRRALDDAVGPREIDMLEDAGAAFAGANGRKLRTPVSLTMISSPGSTSRRIVAPITSSATVSEAKMVASPSLPMTSGRMPSGSRQATRPFGGQAEQRIGALDLAQRIGQPVERGRIARGRDEVDDHLGVAGRLEDRAAPDERGAQRHRVRQVAVVGDREAALGQIGEQRLDVAQRGLAGGRIADMADRDLADSLRMMSSRSKLPATWPMARWA